MLATAFGAIDPIMRGWAVVTGAGVVRLVLGFVASIVVARALGPTGFGIYGVLAATVAIVGALAEGGLTEAAVLRIAAAWPNDAAEAAHRGRAFFWLRLGFSALVVGGGCALASWISPEVLRLPDDGGLVRLAWIGIVATAASGAVSGMLQATGRFGSMSSLTLANTGLTAALAVVLAVLGQLTLTSALVVLGIGTSLAAFVLGLRLLPRGWDIRPPSPAQLREEARHLVRTGRWLWVASLFAMLAANLDVVLLNRWSVLATVGAYALALNLATKADLVNQSLYTVLLPAASTLRDAGSVLAYLRSGLLRSGLICLGLLVLIPLAEPFILLVYGQGFAATVGLFRVLLGVVMFDVLTTPALLLPLSYGQPRLLAAGDALRAGTLGLVGLMLIPPFGAGGAVAARLAARLAGAVLVLGFVWRASASLQVKHEEATGVLEQRQATQA